MIPETVGVKMDSMDTTGPTTNTFTNPNKYFIREKDGTMVEIDFFTAAHMIDQGKLSFVRKSFKKKRVVEHFETHTESTLVVEVHRQYARANREPAAKVKCTKPCCNY